MQCVFLAIEILERAAQGTRSHGRTRHTILFDQAAELQRSPQSLTTAQGGEPKYHAIPFDLETPADRLDLPTAEERAEVIARFRERGKRWRDRRRDAEDDGG